MNLIDQPGVLYAALAIGSFLFSLLLNRLFLRFSSNLGTRKHEEFIRWTSEMRPSVGGLSFYILFLISIVALAMLPETQDSIFDEELLGLFSACTLGFLIGLADDAYNTNPVLKFLGQFTCANILIAANLYIAISPDLFINYIFTIVWVIGIMNAMNMLDNMDGVAGGVSLAIINSVIVVVLLGATGFSAYMVIFFCVAASILGFLYYNWHPAKIFMGDTGSQFLGVFLAAISIKFLWHFKDNTYEYFQVKQFLLPLLVFIMPIIDTITVFVRRLWKKRSPFIGGKDHTTHLLAYNGLSDGMVAFVFFMISAMSILIIYLIFPFFEQWEFRYSLMILAYFIMLLIMFQIIYERGRKRESKLHNTG